MSTNAVPSPLFEPLEPRQHLSVLVVSPIADYHGVRSQSPAIIDLTGRFDDPDVFGTVVKFDTVMGDFFAELFDVASNGRSAAPQSVAHFLAHVHNLPVPGSTDRYSSYDNTVIHRADPGNGVIQGGAFAFPGWAPVLPGPTLDNEYSATRPNVRGTLGWAKRSGDPDSATNQWFINTRDNSAGFGPINNGGFTTFGRVLGDGMDLVDDILALPTFTAAAAGITSNANLPIGSQIPLRNTPPTASGADNAVTVQSVRVVGEVVYSVSSNNAGLVVPTIEGQSLRLDFIAGQTGSAAVTVRATDHSGAFAETTFNVAVAAPVDPPTLTALKPSAAAIPRGNDLVLTALGAADAAPGAVVAVEFYRDANGNGIFDLGTDTSLEADTDPAGGFSLRRGTAGQATGAYTYFARAIDDQGQPSAPVTATVNVVNTPPTIGRIELLGTLQRNQSGTISYDLLTTFSDEADRNGDTITFVLDQVLSGTLTKNSQPVTPGVTTLGPGESWVWTPALNADGILDAFRFRASDGEAASTGSATLRLIVNKPPVVTSFTSTPAFLGSPGGELLLKALANDPDVGGAVAKIEFYRDTNNNGTLDLGTDTKLGEDANPDGGWSLRVTATSAFPTGQVRLFARATDNQGGAGSAVPLLIDVFAPPVIGGFTASAVNRPGPMTLTATGVTDPAVTIDKVEFFLDRDGDGVIDAFDTPLGVGVKQTGVDDYRLDLASTAAIPFGQTKFIVRATNDRGGSSLLGATFEVGVGPNSGPPAVTALAASTALVNRGQALVLTATGVSDPDGGVQRIDFFRDDGDGVFNSATDLLLGTDFSDQGGWTFSYTIPSSLATGPRKFFARAADLDGTLSPAAAVEVTVNPPPTIGSLVSAASVLSRSDPLGLRLAALNVADTLGGTIRQVEFWRDANNNSSLDGSDTFLGFGEPDAPGSSTYRFSISAGFFPAGLNRFFARAVDNNNAISSTVNTTVTLF